MRDRGIFVAVGFRRARSRDARKAGRVFLRLAGASVRGEYARVSVNTDISGQDEGVFTDRRERILEWIAAAGERTEDLAAVGVRPTVEGVAEHLRKLLAASKSMFRHESKPLCEGRRLRKDLFNVAAPWDRLLEWETEGPGKSPEDLMTFAARLEDEYAEAGRRASAHALGALRGRFGEWLENDRIPWEDVGPDFERKFASWLATRGIAQSTQSFYCKRLRTLLLRASAAGLLP